MDFLEKNDLLFTHPKGVLMYIIGFFLLLFVAYLVFKIKSSRKDIFQAYALYVFFIALWVLSNAYFHSSLLIYLDSSVAKVMALIATASFTFSGLVFYYFSCLMRYGRRAIGRLSWSLIASIAVINLFFNAYPNLTIRNVNIIDVGQFELIFGFGNSLIFVIGVIMLIISYGNFFITLKKQNIRIENVRFFYIFFGMSLMYFSAVVFMVLVPTLFNNYSYVWIPPFLSILDLVIVGYAILNKRFLDLRLFVSNLLKAIISFVFSIIIAYFSSILVGFVFETDSFVLLYSLAFMVGIFFYLRVYKYLNSRTFYYIFGVSDTQYLRWIIHNLKERRRVYKSVLDLQSDIRKSFSLKGKVMDCRIILIDKKIHKIYPSLIVHFETHRQVLVTEEVKFIESKKKKLLPLLQELESLGGVCLPLYTTNRELIGLFTLGKKRFNHLYSKEEIEVLEGMGSHLSMLVNEILYNAELEKEVRHKTIELRKKIKEANELIKQQSDFIAVTAHEFRTPLSIAMFQMEDILNKLKNGNELERKLNVINSSLSTLYELTRKLFQVQQYDLDKVSLRKQPISLQKFIQKIYGDFLGPMQKKQIDFQLINNLKKDYEIDVDQGRMQQVLHNLLDNAYKFTQERGSVILQIDRSNTNLLIKVIDNGKGVASDLKKAIFNKFRNDSRGSGIGLGLYLCKKIVELHEGEIWVEDTPGEGATFVICLLPNEDKNS